AAGELLEGAVGAGRLQVLPRLAGLGEGELLEDVGEGPDLGADGAGAVERSLGEGDGVDLAGAQGRGGGEGAERRIRRPGGAPRRSRSPVGPLGRARRVFGLRSRGGHRLTPSW